MKLLVLSDLHLEDGLFRPAVVDADVVVLAGDIHAPGHEAVMWAQAEPAFSQAEAIILVPGNHEYHGTVMRDELQLMRELACGSRVHVLDTDELHIAGVRFLGCTLWTDFRLRLAVEGFPDQPLRLLSDMPRAMTASRRYMPDYREIMVRHAGSDAPCAMTPIDSQRIHRHQKQWLRRKLAEPFAGPTVVVTHHAPARGSLDPRLQADPLSASFVSELLPLFFDVPTLWIHGHTHQSHQYWLNNCQVLCNPRGYVRWDGEGENKSFIPGLVVAVDLSSGSNYGVLVGTEG